MADPVFIAQTAEPMTPYERQVWIEDQLRKAKEQGVTFWRATIDPEFANTLERSPARTLIEGWATRPDDQGEPRWQDAKVEAPLSPPHRFRRAPIRGDD